MTSSSTINVERVLAEEVDGEKTFVKRRERKEGFPSDLEVESQYVKGAAATSFPEAYHWVQFIKLFKEPSTLLQIIRAPVFS